MHQRVYVAAGVVCAFAVLCVASFFITKVPTQTVRRCAKDLLSQAAQWHALSVQDSNDIFAMQHANYAVAYITAARRIMSDIELEQATGLNVHKLVKKMQLRQKESVGSLCKVCKKSMPKGATMRAWV